MPTQKTPFLPTEESSQDPTDLTDTPTDSTDTPALTKDPTANVFDPSNPFCIYRLDEMGRIEQTNLLTGERLKITAHQREVANKELHNLVVPHRTISGEVIFANRGMGLAALYKACGRRKQEFSWLLAESICERLREGEFLTVICKEQGMPSYGTLCRWRREHPEFADMLRDARKDKAEWFFEQSILAVEEADERKNSIDLARLRSDVFAKAAKVLNSEFSETKKVEATVGVKVLKADTGIRRPGDEGYDAQIFQDVSLQLGEVDESELELEVESLDE
jgi:hypothetical protein